MSVQLRHSSVCYVLIVKHPSSFGGTLRMDSGGKINKKCVFSLNNIPLFNFRTSIRTLFIADAKSFFLLLYLKSLKLTLLEATKRVNSFTR